MTFVDAQSLCHVALVPAAGHRASATRVHAPFLLRVAAAERSSPCCEWALTRPVLYRVVCTCQYQSPDPSTPLPHLGILTFVLYICISISGKHLNFLFLKYWKLRCRSSVICLRSHLQCVVTEGPNSITAASFINSPNMEATQGSMDGWLVKQQVIYTYKGIPFSLKKGRTMPRATAWMDLETWR